MNWAASLHGAENVDVSGEIADEADDSAEDDAVGLRLDEPTSPDRSAQAESRQVIATLNASPIKRACKNNRLSMQPIIFDQQNKPSP